MKFVKWLKKQYEKELSTYFYQMNQCQLNGQQKWTKLLLKPRNQINSLCLIYWFAIFWLKLDSSSTLFYLDFIQVHQLSRVPQLILVCVALHNFYYQRLLFYANDSVVTRTIKHLIQGQSYDCFTLFSYIQNRQVLSKFKRNSFIHWLLIIVFRLISDLAIASLFLLVVQYVWAHLEVQPLKLNQLLQLTINSCFLTLSTATIAYIIHCYVCIAILSNHLERLTLRILQLQVWQAHQLLDQAKHQSVLSLILFTRCNRKILLQIIEANACYGKALFAFILVFSPISSYQLMSLATGRVVTPINYLYTFNAFPQLVAIVINHELIADFNSYFLKSNHKFYSCLVRCASFISLRTSLHLSLYFQAFHSRKRYGFSYNRFGRISKLSFTRSMLMYTQLLMYIYMMVRRLH